MVGSIRTVASCPVNSFIIFAPVSSLTEICGIVDRLDLKHSLHSYGKLSIPKLGEKHIFCLEFAKVSKNIDYSKPYILTYFLGNRSEQIESDMKKYAREYNYKLYNLMDYTQFNVFISGPSEFIYLIEHASLVLTDSFHACVFSFLFNKPFLVYSRQSDNMENMMSRIETFLSKFHLERKYVNSGLINDVMECDYIEGFKQLEIERKKVIEFLKMSMKIK